MIKFSEKDANATDIATLLANEEIENQVLIAFQEKLNNQIIKYTKSIVENSFFNCSSPELTDVSDSFLDISKVLKTSGCAQDQCRLLSKNLESLKTAILSHPKMQYTTMKSKIDDYNKKYSEIDKKISSATLELQAFVTEYEKNQILEKFKKEKKEKEEQEEKQRLLGIIQKKAYKKAVAIAEEPKQTVEKSEESAAISESSDTKSTEVIAEQPAIELSTTTVQEPTIELTASDVQEPAIEDPVPDANESAIEDPAPAINKHSEEKETDLFNPAENTDEEESLFDFDINKESILDDIEEENSSDSSKPSAINNDFFSEDQFNNNLEEIISKPKRIISGYRNDLKPNPEAKAKKAAEKELPDSLEIDDLERTLAEIDNEYYQGSSENKASESIQSSNNESESLETSETSTTSSVPAEAESASSTGDASSSDEIEIQENTLIISEKNKTVTFPYTISELESKFTANPDKYKDIKDIIKKEYTKPLSAYKNSAFARFREAYKLIRKKNKGSQKHALDLAAEVFFKSNLHPAIISACKNVDELDVYLSCLEFDELEDFKIFNIVFDMAPAVVNKKKLVKENS